MLCIRVQFLTVIFLIPCLLNSIHSTKLSSNYSTDPFTSLNEPGYTFLRETIHYLQTSLNRSSKCGEDVSLLFQEAVLGKQNALQFFDAMGKPSSGVLEGGDSYIGSFSECLSAKTHDIFGQYCLANINFNKNTLSQNETTEFLPFMKMSIAICVPSSCQIMEVENAIKSAAANMYEGAVAGLEMCQAKDSTPKLDEGAWIVIGLLSLFLIVAIIGTTLDLCLSTKEDISKSETNLQGHIGPQSDLSSSSNVRTTVETNRSNETLYKTKIKTEERSIINIFRAFSLPRNIQKILDTGSAEDSTKSLHGIRFLSMAWIITGHTFSFASSWLFFRNPITMTSTRENLLAQGFANGTFSVDTFFFIGGFLMAYTMFKNMKKMKGKFNILSLYLHRYIRMTPLMMFVIAFSACLLRYMGSGVTWSKATLMYDDWCRQNWWTNALYVQNFVHTENMCLSHTWYSAIDMQFYLISPLIIKLCSWHTYGAVASLTTLFLVTGICPLIYTFIYNFPAIPHDQVPLDLMNMYYKFIYIKPYCRMGPYLVGVALAYYMYRNDFSIYIPKKYLLAGWPLAIAVNLTVIYSMDRVYGPNPPSTAEAAFYNGFARSAWAATIAWITVNCITGQAGIINRILSLPVFVPLSRLTYCAYLIHPVLMALFYGTREQVFDFSTYWLIYLVLGNMAITYILSLVFSALFESPILNIEKLFHIR